MAVDLARALSSPMVSDGAWAAQLDLLGCPPGCCRDEWNLSHAELVLEVATSYVKAGSQIIRTNTFGANALALERYSLADKAKDINLAGAQISKQAAGDQAWVFGSMGPSGRMLVIQEVSENDLYKIFHAQAQALAAGGVDGIICESMTELAECLAALRAAKDAAGLPVIASMTFDTGPDLKTTMGVSPADAAENLARAGADAIGCNCGVGIDGCAKVAAVLREHCGLPIWVRPDASQPEIDGNEATYRETSEAFADRVHLLLEAGANLVGGCCGTTPAYIARAAGAIRTWSHGS